MPDDETARPRRAATARIDRVAVVVPAHDEALRVEACLRSARRAVRAAGVPALVVLVADACTDDTARLARPLADVVTIHARTVGIARRAGITRACSRLSARAREGLWIATTDADSVVPTDWITAQLAHAAAGADAVAGRVEVGDWHVRPTGTRERFDAEYRDGPEHGHVHGANLGFSARAHDEVGGIAPLATGEDVDLVRRLEAAGRRVVWSTATVVSTSGRSGSRAPQGFAGHLDGLEAGLEAGLAVRPRSGVTGEVAVGARGAAEPGATPEDTAVAMGGPRP